MKKNEKIPKTKTTDPERETRVLLEDIRKQVQIVAEGHGIIITKLEEHDKRFEGMDQRFEKIDGRFDRIDQRFERIDQRFERIEVVLTDTNERVKSIENKLDDHKVRITKLEEKVFS